jgi:DNA-binding MarR family transcriptional regulator
VKAETARFVAQIGAFYEQEGYAPITGRLFARLLLAPEPMTLSDLVRDLGVSNASVSTDARRLERQGIVERVRRPGDRKAYYQVAGDLAASVIRLRIDRIRGFRAVLGRSVPGQGLTGNAVRRRLTELDRVNQYLLEGMIRLLAGWEASAEQASPSSRQESSKFVPVERKSTF